jgi:hypothetical protein
VPHTALIPYLDTFPGAALTRCPHKDTTALCPHSNPNQCGVPLGLTTVCFPDTFAAPWAAEMMMMMMMMITQRLCPQRRMTPEWSRLVCHRFRFRIFPYDYNIRKAWPDERVLLLLSRGSCWGGVTHRRAPVSAVFGLSQISSFHIVFKISSCHIVFYVCDRRR